jgi:SAM-dependent methyltransferase
MNDILSAFDRIMHGINAHPFHAQEALCNRISFVLEDHMKRFPAYAIRVYKDVFGTLSREAGFNAKDKVILEIGPGFSVGVLFLAGLSGAAKVCAVDAFPHDKGSDNDYIASMYGHLLNDRSFLIGDARHLDENAFTDTFARFVRKDAQSGFAYRPEKLEFHFPFSVEHLPFANDVFDCVYSFATFEHFRDPQAAAAELNRITKPGGINFHSVDLRDHRNFEEPLEFLSMTEDSWQEQGRQSNGYSFTNRLRSPEIVRCFANHGFSPLKELPFLTCSVSPDLRKRLAPGYQDFSDEVLGILGCQYIFKK